MYYRFGRHIAGLVLAVGREVYPKFLGIVGSGKVAAGNRFAQEFAQRPPAVADIETKDAAVFV
jgi:hypothetical protein